MFSGKNLLALILTGLLFLSAALSAVCAVLYVRGSGELRGLQTQAAAIDNNRNLTRALATDAMEYSKRNPAIDPILRSVGLKSESSSPKVAK
ncbi:MAG: hypothetical protein ABIR24_14460 [Verrucomicrobiota bacterium]